MSVLYKIFLKDFKIIKFCFFLLTSFFLYGEFRQFLIEKPSLTSDARTTLAPNHFPDVLICKIEGYDKKQLKFHGYETSYQYAIDEFLRYTINYINFILSVNKICSLGVPSKRTFFGWRGENGNFTVQEVEEDVSAIKTIRLKCLPKETFL